MTTVRLAEFGILPNTDITLALCELMKKYTRDAEFVFEAGDYYFSPHDEMHADYRLSNTTHLPYRTLGVWLRGHENCIVNGNGARLWFEGQMQPFTLDRCKNVTVHGFTVDWKKPLVAEGTVRAVGEGYADLYIDPAAFPHEFHDNNIYFDTGAGEFYPLGLRGSIIFDENNNSVSRATGDVFASTRAEDLGGHVYRCYSYRTDGMKIGSVVVLRHNDRVHAGIFSEKCEDLTFSDITVHSCGGLGCLAQFCRDLTYERVHFLPNRRAGRRVSGGRDDGMHLTSNSGHITVTECSFLGLMDDPINVHGCCVIAQKAGSRRTLRCRYAHGQAKGFHYWAEAGDEISFIERAHMTSVGVASVESYELDESCADLTEFTLHFSDDLPDGIIDLANCGDALALDNLTHTASFTCTKNRFGSCRARGILVSTPKKVVIRDNYFCSSGSAILVAGDSNYWFESGECHDIEISHNTFTDLCLSSMYQFCDGVVSICPVVPEPQTDKPYHKNIRITNNTFDTPATPVLYAYSTGGLTFEGNLIFVSLSAEKWHPSDSWVKLEYCSDVRIGSNTVVGECDGLGLGIDGWVDEEHCERVEQY